MDAVAVLGESAKAESAVKMQKEIKATFFMLAY